MYLTLCMMPLLLAAPEPEHMDMSFDIWDWTAPAQDIEVFETWVNDLAELGFTRIEMSVPWRLVEPEPGKIDLTWLEDRLAVCKAAGLGMRLRINSYYAGAKPDWYDGDVWMNIEGEPVHQHMPSITDDRFWAHYGPLCTAIAELCAGEDVLHDAFIGVHAELKWADWWSYDPSSLALWREAIEVPRPDWLRAVVDDDIALPADPPEPGPTAGTPDTDPVNRAWIAFREQCWRDAMARFAEAIRAGDPDARISAPLGESYRRGSAQMSNLDYWGMTREADEVVHSYDFFWHLEDGAWQAAASVDAFRGITGLPTQFEYDAYGSTFGWGYSYAQLLAIGREAMRAGAGLKVANYSYNEDLPSEFDFLHDLVQLWEQPLPRAPIKPDHEANREETVLLFFSKWANYLYREPTEWLHEAQFGVYKLFRDLGIPVRIICEDNLDEDLSGYWALFMAFSPLDLLPEPDRVRIKDLNLPRIADVEVTPPLFDSADPAPKAEGLSPVTLAHESAPVGPTNLADLGDDYTFALESGDMKLGAHRPGHVVLGYPIGTLYLHDPECYVHQGLVLWALNRATE